MDREENKSKGKGKYEKGTQWWGCKGQGFGYIDIYFWESGKAVYSKYRISSIENTKSKPWPGNFIMLLLMWHAESGESGIWGWKIFK